MKGHPALAYIVAQGMLQGKRREASSHHQVKTAPKKRSMRLGRYRLTITKEIF